jgi:NhaP-type Na+/H+ or K+/H+ antiporter
MPELEIIPNFSAQLPIRAEILTLMFGFVIFSILVQELILEPSLHLLSISGADAK